MEITVFTATSNLTFQFAPCWGRQVMAARSSHQLRTLWFQLVWGSTEQSTLTGPLFHDRQSGYRIWWGFALWRWEGVVPQWTQYVLTF